VAEVSLEVVKKISVMSIIEELPQIKRQEVLKECRDGYYSEDYSRKYVRRYIKATKKAFKIGRNILFYMDHP